MSKRKKWQQNNTSPNHNFRDWHARIILYKTSCRCSAANFGALVLKTAKLMYCVYAMHSITAQRHCYTRDINLYATPGSVRYNAYEDEYT